MNDLTLEIFGPAIHARWKSQSSMLKDDLMNFNKIGVTSKACLYLKYLRDQYRVHLKINPKYERPPTIPEREWKALVEDAKEKAL